MGRGSIILSFFSKPLDSADMWVIGIVAVTICVLGYIGHLFFLKKRGLLLRTTKNSTYFPTSIGYRITNKRKKSVWIGSVILKFSKLGVSKKFKIKSTDGAQIYPLELLPKESHELAISLKPFFTHNPELCTYYTLHIYVEMEDGTKKHKRIMLRPTLFRKEHQNHKKATR